MAVERLHWRLGKHLGKYLTNQEKCLVLVIHSGQGELLAIPQLGFPRTIILLFFSKSSLPNRQISAETLTKTDIWKEHIQEGILQKWEQRWGS